MLIRVNRSLSEATKKLTKKFELLECRQQPALMVKQSKVINLSKHSLDDTSFNVLEQGLNFAVAPRRIPHKDIICCIEDSVKILPEEKAEEVRQDCAAILRKAKPPKSNISGEEAGTLRNLCTNKDIMVMKADKGNDTVKMDSEDYHNKMIEHLTPSGSYKKIGK